MIIDRDTVEVGEVVPPGHTKESSYLSRVATNGNSVVAAVPAGWNLLGAIVCMMLGVVEAALIHPASFLPIFALVTDRDSNAT